MLLTLKLLLTPCLIASIALVERRWGTAVSGWFMGFPFISAPISLVVALQYGPGFAARSAVGTLSGLISVCAFCVVYIGAARKASWPACLGAATAAFLGVTAVLNAVNLPLGAVLVLAGLTLGGALRLIPPPPAPGRPAPPPRWELPVRMGLAVAFVWALTTLANVLGPSLSGLLAPYPVMNSVVADLSQSRHALAS